ncbi:pyruvate dehydrogenase E2 component (dihydrolipoamide acetyltransferase) [Capronia coronata CBS 617.96]|uniref:Acetyltransferase component of pyruvate dehydrogenase complex n=1 Tax=Capronia coronata CBS 617.96 TaxID=1182541 RepID=W9YDS9_9EURO|nr:pyruvate dehydrogenase E2 component (dihydrolipoamide acetyltransferase) [Capronia coronata CBS 617.96]EXJ90693.1 pyruvate dehydrogenase E2 component (dihydrolipoamide acetyltransferase) [Capronia coronata CBS 617.96]
MATSTLLCRSGSRLFLQAAPSSKTSRNALQRLQNVAASQRLPCLSVLSRYYASKPFPPHTVITMPALSPTMTAGNVGTWQKKVGDKVEPGDVLVEIETDKAQMDFEYQEEGVLAKILKEAGEKDIPVGNPIGVMVEEGTDIAAFEEFTLEDAGGDKGPPKEQPKEEASEASEAPDSGSATAPPSEAKEPASDAVESDSSGGRLQPVLDREPNISFAAKKLALEKGVPIKDIKGTGPGGRITVSDVEKFNPASSAAATTGPAYEDIPASSMRKVIATRLQESMNQNPHYYVSATLSVTKLLKLREALNAAADGKYKLSVNDFLIKACAIACKKVPTVNSSWRENGGQVFIRQHNTVDVSVAVATPVGLMTPIVKNADSIGLSSISSAVKDLGKRARDGKLKPEEYQGGTFTISNMGMNAAVERFTAVINPPQAAILAVGTTRKVAVPVETEEGIVTEWDDQIVVTGSFDHKVVDGAVGAEWIRELKKVIENPLEMML